MNLFANFGKLLIYFGIIFIFLGILILTFSKIRGIGHLPGDVYIQKKNFIFYFPLASSILLSLILSFLAWIFSKK